MDAEQALYLTQARSDFAVFDLLARADACHQLHYLQMVTEKLAKAYFWRQGNPLQKRHDYFVRFLRAVRGRGDVGRVVGIKPSSNWESYADSLLPLALTIEAMAPSEADDGPNAEYPWPHAAPVHAPATFVFAAWDDIAGHRGQRLLALLRLLLERFEQFS